MPPSPAGTPPSPATAAAEGKRPLGRPPGKFSQHRRLAALRAQLEQHPRGVTIYELAAKLDVTPRSMRRYLKEIGKHSELLVGAKRPGGPQLWRLAPGDIPRKVGLRRHQAYALLAARKLFEPLRGSTLFEEIDLAASSLLAVARRPGRGPNAGVADARLEERFLYLPFAPKLYADKANELDDLFQAVADLRALRCRYRRTSDGRDERLTLHPYAMVLYKDAIYCVGLHVAQKVVRTFLLDRMSDTECVTKAHFKLPADFVVTDYFQGQFGMWHGDDRTRVVVEFDATVAEFVRTRRVHTSQCIDELEGGGVRLTMELGDMTEVATWVLGFGKTARVVEPASLVEAVTGELRAALGRYEPPRKKRPKAVSPQP